MLFLESNDALTLLKDNVMPFSHPAVSFNLTDRIVILVTETDLIDPILTGFDSNLANGLRPNQID